MWDLKFQIVIRELGSDPSAIKTGQLPELVYRKAKQKPKPFLIWKTHASRINCPSNKILDLQKPMAFGFPSPLTDLPLVLWMVEKYHRAFRKKQNPLTNPFFLVVSPKRKSRRCNGPEGCWKAQGNRCDPHNCHGPLSSTTKGIWQPQMGMYCIYMISHVFICIYMYLHYFTFTSLIRTIRYHQLVSYQKWAKVGFVQGALWSETRSQPSTCSDLGWPARA